jgi:hypothetical protein
LLNTQQRLGWGKTGIPTISSNTTLLLRARYTGRSVLLSSTTLW